MNELVEISLIFWLSHGNAVKRIFKLYTAVVKSLKIIEEIDTYDANDRLVHWVSSILCFKENIYHMFFLI